MAKKKRAKVPPLVLPERLVPDLDKWGSPVEEHKTALRNAWLDEHELTYQYFFEYVPALLAERRRLAGMPPTPPARRKGRLPERVRRLLADLEREPASELDDSELLKKLFPKPVRRLVKGKDPDTLDDDDEPDDE